MPRPSDQQEGSRSTEDSGNMENMSTNRLVGSRTESEQLEIQKMPYSFENCAKFEPSNKNKQEEESNESARGEKKSKSDKSQGSSEPAPEAKTVSQPAPVDAVPAEATAPPGEFRGFQADFSSPVHEEEANTEGVCHLTYFPTFRCNCNCGIN